MLDVTGNKREEEVEEVSNKPRYDWRFENNISNGKELIDIENNEFKYTQRAMNSHFSYFRDTVFYANQMNLHPHIDNKMHYDYLFYSIRKHKSRFKQKKNAELEQQIEEKKELFSLIQSVYKYNVQKTKDALRLLSEKQLNIIIEKEKNKG